MVLGAFVLWSPLTDNCLVVYFFHFSSDLNTERFRWMLIYFNMDTQYGIFWGNHLYQATEWHLNNRWTVKNSEKWNKKTYLVLVKFLQLVGMTVTCEQAIKTQPKQDKSFSYIFHHFWPFICSLSVILCLDKGDFPKNVHTVSLC